MPRYIDADELRDWFQNLADDDWNQGTGTTWANAFSEAVDIVDDSPTADVVEVVRCKECKYGHELIDEKGRRYRLCNYHFGHGLMVEDHGFCKWGERRNDG